MNRIQENFGTERSKESPQGDHLRWQDLLYIVKLRKKPIIFLMVIAVISTVTSHLLFIPSIQRVQLLLFTNAKRAQFKV